jgi:hypothetical protein
MDVVEMLWLLIIKANKLAEMDYLIPQFAAHATYERRKKIKNIRLFHM